LVSGAIAGGGDPMVRYRELEVLLPQIEAYKAKTS
jgi:hypothetical protein